MINYVIGDATCPKGDGPKLIAHITNDVGAWGKGFVLALSRKWKLPEMTFRKKRQKLGDVQFVKVDEDLYVANMCSQHGIVWDGKKAPFREEAFKQCLEEVAQFCLSTGCSFHGPKMGAGLAGGKWNQIEPIIEEYLVKRGIASTIYCLVK